MIIYSVEKDFDSVTKNITLKYSVCKCDITHAAKIFSKKYHIMHSICRFLKCKDKWTDSLKASLVVLVVKNPPANAGDIRDKRCGFDPWIRKMATFSRMTESHGQRSLAGYI